MRIPLRIPLRFLVGISLVVLVLSSLSAWAGPRVKVLDNPIRMRFSSFSTSLAVLGDVTGDGIPDYLVGAYDQPYAKEGMTGMELGVGGPSGKTTQHRWQLMPVAKKDNLNKSIPRGGGESRLRWSLLGKDETVIRVYPFFCTSGKSSRSSCIEQNIVSKGHLSCVSLYVSWPVFH